MKKISLLAVFLLVSTITVKAQGSVQFGITGGLVNASGDIRVAGFDISNILGSFDIDILNGTGFYVGAVADIEATEKLHVQPELLYASVGGEGAILIPVMAKYYVAEKFNLQAGPQLDFVLNVPSIAEPIVNETGVSLGIGAGYDINEDFAVQAKYTFGLTDRLDSSIDDILSSSLKIDILQIGLIYNLN